MEFKELEIRGKTITKILGKDGFPKFGDESITYECDDGSEYIMQHYQDCCEYVRVEEVIGHWEDLIGLPLFQAEEASENKGGMYNSETWTFYKFATMKGYVTLRWLGESNGYYSEDVSFSCSKQPS